MSVMATVYNAITNDTTLNTLIGGRLHWNGKPTSSETFPLLNYFTLDEVGDYSFGSTLAEVKQEAESVTIQIDIYADTGQFINMNDIKSRLKIVMNSMGYRQLGGAETFDESITKIIRATRWELNNVSDF